MAESIRVFVFSAPFSSFRMSSLWKWCDHNTEVQSVIYHLKAGIGAGITRTMSGIQILVCDRTCKFSEGKTLEDGESEKVAVRNKVRTLYPRKNLGLMKPEGTKALTEHEDELNHEE